MHLGKAVDGAGRAGPAPGASIRTSADSPARLGAGNRRRGRSRREPPHEAARSRRLIPHGACTRTRRRPRRAASPRGESEVGPAAERRVDRSHGLAGEALRRHLHHVDLRMARRAAGAPRRRHTRRLRRRPRGSSAAPARLRAPTTARSSSAIEMCSRGVWSSCESPGPYATAWHPQAGTRMLRSDVPGLELESRRAAGRRGSLG